ncbi:MAG: hypothetical protein J2P22_11820 [Nocardioides sp.]|nr:hypothetical protein [Nocardioides sp.]
MVEAPAFYARRGGRLADWWTVLHPPYTVWHLSYVVLGAALAPHRDWTALAMSVLAFFFAVGVAAHALDERTGRPLGTAIPDRVLTAAAAVSLALAAGLGLYGALWWHGTNVALLVAVPVGVTLVVAYNLELLGGHLHNNTVFALAWGGFPVVVGYVAQSPGLEVSGIASLPAATAAAVALTTAQRHLSTPARELRRRTIAVSGSLTTVEGEDRPLDRGTLLAPLEGGLRALSWAVPLVALALLLART